MQNAKSASYMEKHPVSPNYTPGLLIQMRTSRTESTNMNDFIFRLPYPMCLSRDLNSHYFINDTKKPKDYDNDRPVLSIPGPISHHPTLGPALTTSLMIQKIKKQ